MNEFLQKINELIPQGPPDYIKKLAEKMGKSEDSIRCYIAGTRGTKKGAQRDVLRYLREIVDEYQTENKLILS